VALGVAVVGRGGGRGDDGIGVVDGGVRVVLGVFTLDVQVAVLRLVVLIGGALPGAVGLARRLADRLATGRSRGGGLLCVVDRLRDGAALFVVPIGHVGRAVELRVDSVSREAAVRLGRVAVAVNLVAVVFGAVVFDA